MQFPGEEGIATFRTVLSSSTVSCARQMTPRISQRWGWPWGRLWGDVVMLYTVKQFPYTVQQRYGATKKGSAHGRHEEGR